MLPNTPASTAMTALHVRAPWPVPAAVRASVAVEVGVFGSMASSA